VRRDGRSSVSPARIDWDAGPAPRAPAFGDLYHSDEGGAAETEHVFLAGNDLPARFDRPGPFAVGELGFGTGLNFLVLWRAWERAAKPKAARLHFVSVEKHPLAPGDQARAVAGRPELSPYAERLVARLPPIHPGPHHIVFEGGVALTLLYGEAEQVLASCEGAIDAWFLDGFSPARNESMWSDRVLDEVARLSAPDATVATYTAAGAVRRGLETRGFAVEKRPGFGRKRDMLAGRRAEGPTSSGPAASDPLAAPVGGWAAPDGLYGDLGTDEDLDQGPPRPIGRAPWFGAHGESLLPPGARVAVVGAGIAGASLAFHLRAAGFRPIVLDGEGPAAGASGNAAGLIAPRLSLGGQPAERFHVDAWLHAANLYRAVAGEAFRDIGVLQLASDEKEADRFRTLVEAEALPADELRLINGPEASAIAGADVEGPALWTPRAGVVDPAGLVRALLGETSVRRARVAAVDATGDGAVLSLEGGERIDADAVVVANALDAARLAPTAPLPLAGSLGQTTLLPDAPPLKTAVAWGPYAVPAPGGGLVLGATYDPYDGDAAPRPERDARNLAAVAEKLAALVRDARPVLGRAAVRCVTPDRAPIAGPLPDWPAALAAYDGLRTGAGLAYPPLPRAPRLWTLTGLGSRGLVTAPLAAALVVADMAGTPSPVERDVAEALHPARFLIRDLRRGRVPEALRNP